MQTFLPYSDFKKTARCLDNKRLGKQRVEAYQILRILAGIGKRNKNGRLAWENHPAVKMWKSYERKLAEYIAALCNEWISRGYKDSIKEKTKELIHNNFLLFYKKYKNPKWLGHKKFHKSHQSNLLRKKSEYYSKYFKNVSDDLPYVWPIDI